MSELWSLVVYTPADPDLITALMLQACISGYMRTDEGVDCFDLLMNSTITPTVGLPAKMKTASYIKHLVWTDGPGSKLWAKDSTKHVRLEPRNNKPISWSALPSIVYRSAVMCANDIHLNCQLVSTHRRIKFSVVGFASLSRSLNIDRENYSPSIDQGRHNNQQYNCRKYSHGLYRTTARLSLI